MKNTKSKLLKENAEEPPGSAFEPRVLKFLDRIFKLNLKYGRHPSKSSEQTCNKEMSAFISYLHEVNRFTHPIQLDLFAYEDLVARYGQTNDDSCLFELNELRSNILNVLGLSQYN